MAWRSHRRDGLRLQSANCSPLDHGITATSLWPSAALDSAHLQGMAWQLHIRLTLESSNEDDVYYGTSSTGLCTRTKGMGLQLVPSENCPPVPLANRITHFASPHKRTMQLLLSFLHCLRDVLDLDAWKNDVIQTCEQRSQRFRLWPFEIWSSCSHEQTLRATQKGICTCLSSWTTASGVNTRSSS